jgi:hypothetical protein
LIDCASGFLSTETRPTKVGVCTCIAIRWESKIDRDLVFARKVGVRDLGVGYLESGTVRDIKGQFGLTKLGLAPIPTT